MSKKIPVSPRTLYLTAVAAGFAAILVFTAFNLLRPADPPAQTPVQARPDTPADSPAPADNLLAPASNSLPAGEKPVQETIVRDGLEIEFSVEPYTTRGEPPAEIRAGEYAVVNFKITEADTGNPVANLPPPAAWLDLLGNGSPRQAGRVEPACKEKVTTYLQGALGIRPDIDLNGYFILVLNNDATISVLDPVIDVNGMTQLYTIILLTRPGEDWAMDRDRQQLFVTMPKANQVAVAGMENFEVTKNINVGRNPVRIAFQPDGRYVWVGINAEHPADSGVTVINPETLEVAARIPTGAGHHEIAFSADSRLAFVTNSQAGTLSVIDARSLEKIKDLPVGQNPVAVAAAGPSVYVALEGDGAIAVVSGDDPRITGQITAEPGLSALRFAPGGQWGFAANPANGRIYIFDTSGNRLRHTVPVEAPVDQISFTQNYAYVRSKSTNHVTGIELAALDKEAGPPLVSLSTGRQPSGQPPLFAAAEAIFPTPDRSAILVANPSDELVYYYQEGMQTPAGAFQGHGRIPRAVRVVNRSLQEIEPGLFSARIRLPDSGEYQMAFLLSGPQIIHCFKFTANPNPLLDRLQDDPLPKLEVLTPGREVKAGEDFTIRFALTDPATGKAIPGLEQVEARVTLSTGAWHESYQARQVASGEYELNFTAPQPGLYYLAFAAPGLNINFDRLPGPVLRATVNRSAGRN